MVAAKFTAGSAAAQPGSPAAAQPPSPAAPATTPAPVDYQDVPARRVPFPHSVSAKARASLARWSQLPAGKYPPLDDKAAWLERIAQTDASTRKLMESSGASPAAQVDSTPVVLGGAKAYRIVPKAAKAGKRILVDIHGGAFTNGGGANCELGGMTQAVAFGVETYALDYRMPPEHPFPAGLDDCVAAYRALLQSHSPENIVVRGISAGGNIAAATMLRVRDAGLPLPAAVLLVTPELDLSESGDSFQTNANFDVVLKGSLMQSNLLYAGGHDLRDPYASPLFGDFTKGYPPTLLTAGTRDLFLSNAARMANALRRAGNYVELIVEEAMPHGGFFGAPEDHALVQDIRDFAERAWGGRLPKRRLA